MYIDEGFKKVIEFLKACLFNLARIPYLLRWG